MIQDWNILDFMKNIHFLLYYSLKFYNNDYFTQNTESIAILKRSTLPLASSENLFHSFFSEKRFDIKNFGMTRIYTLRNPEVTVVRALRPLFREMILLPPKNTKFKGPGAQRSARCQVQNQMTLTTRLINLLIIYWLLNYMLNELSTRSFFKISHFIAFGLYKCLMRF